MRTFTENARGLSPWSPVQKTAKLATVPSPPDFTFANFTTRYTVQLLWENANPNGDDVLEYRVEMRSLNDEDADAGDSWATIRGGIETPSLIVTMDRLLPSQLFEFRAFARNAVGWSVPGNVWQGQTPPGPVFALVYAQDDGAAFTTGRSTVSWLECEDVDRYTWL